MALLATLLALRKDARILKIPPYLSAFLILVGLGWLLVLPLNEYSRATYVSENALLPGQVHTYFTGSEHNIFRAYRHEVAGLVDMPVQQRTEKLSELFRATNLKVATQKYAYTPSGRNISNENVYAVLQGPRADATEAIVLMASLKTMDDEHNYSGVALVLALARYFKRWSLWSKDIIFLVSGDSTSGPQAWVDAYHDAHDPSKVESLAIKSGALQGAVGVEYPAGPWGHRYDKLHVVYDGTNGQLPNLDLFNTAVNIASGQMGIRCTLQRMWNHRDTYQERLQTMLRGMLSQGLGHATGPHSAFIPYHIDAITLVTVGDGWHDEMGLGRTVESLFRSLNNLLEHLHQSFFFYLLLEAKRFVSIGTYLPSAMLIAANFSITAIALWVQSGRWQEPIPNPAATKPVSKPATSESSIEPKKQAEEPTQQEEPPEQKDTEPPTTLVSNDGATAIIPTAALPISERPLFLPAAFVLTAHLFGLIPLAIFNTLPVEELYPSFLLAANITILLPLGAAFFLSQFNRPTPQETTLIHCFSLLFLGMFLSALATLNFSQSLMVGLLTAPLSFVRRGKGGLGSAAQFALLAAVNPVMVVQAAAYAAKVPMLDVLVKAAEGWEIWGLWTQVVMWLVWWPAWFCGSVVVASGLI
ncbi:Glycosylphosphatidylinositol:protein transamidase, GAA1 component [Bimuria novae-zelandiae CBS 107.79]|uniref:Glycosylphosphatidylinositol:protein transamidase, GAA1 component n=1 Tax=Bimuria novae-zelandiae CBS 107.79 TaxID=1447943 RepID=A0A6A5VIW4_9PLEO|nr:Glycosylphosphatidylinositol:protein transamidase, GAA1 component [Bimuria novae-zelandiae CBS 107.79]